MDIQYYILGVLAFSQKPNKNDSYPLPPIDFWTTEFCNTLNEMEFGKNKFVLSASDKGLAECCSDEVKKIFKHFPDAYKVDSIYIRKLPDCNFVHLNRTVILSEDSEKCAKECANCIREGLGLLKTFEEQMEALKCKSSECATIEDCETIAKCCALSAQVNLDNKRSVTGSDHDCWNELLQNVDDHIAEDGKLHITLNRDSLTLSYMERGVGGFTAKDFVAVCTLGNSGNVSAGQEDQGNPSATGHKGTGFKSVYNYFEKVTIESGNIKCILDDTVKYDYSNCITDKEVDLSKRGQGIKYGTSVEKKRFPVPEFEALPHKAAATTITFTFKNGGDGYDKLLEQIGLKENIPEKYYFLKHIKKIIYNETSLIALDDIRKNQFYFREECFEVTKDLLNKNPRWEKTSVDDFKKSEKNKVQFLFPKEKLPESTNVFCTLPVCGESLDIPFYINCPALELEDSRNKIQGQSVKDWNDEIKKLAYSGQDSCFHRSFTKFAEDPQNIAIAYKYFPYNYIGNWKNIESIPFLQTTDDGNSMYLMSLEQWYVKLPEGHQTMLPDERKNGFVILPQYMYDWFEHKGDLDGYQTSVPFLYYPDMKEWFAEGTGFLNRLCNIYKYTQDTVFDTLRQLFQSNQNCVGSVVVDIINFFNEKFYSIGVFNISKENHGEFCQTTLRELYNCKDINYAKYAKYYCYRWYLGKDICEGKYHSLDGLQVTGWEPIRKNREKCEEFFGLEKFDVEQFLLCFPNLRDKLYFKRNISDLENPQHTPVEPDDEFLAQAFKENELETLCNLADEANVETGKAFFDKNRVAIQLGDGSYALSAEKELMTSKFLKEDFILQKPDWAKGLLPNLDEKMKSDQYYEKTDLPFLERFVPKYREIADIAEIASIHKAIGKYLENAKSLEAKERFLFEQLMAWGSRIELQWHEKYRPMLKQYDRIINECNWSCMPYFRFADDSFSEVPDYIKQQLQDRLDTEEYKKYNANDNKIRYSTLGEGGYCVSWDKNYCWAVFGERGLGQLFRDQYHIQAYLSPRQYTAMSSYAPLPLFRAYDTELDQIEPCAVKKLPENNAYDEWKSLLLKRFEWRKDTKWHCAAGYGDPEQYKSACPVCGGKLVAEATSLRIKNVRLCQQTHIPVLLCRNCADAFHYSYDVYFCKGNDDPEKLEDKEARSQIEQTDEMYICFRLSGHESKIFPMKLTLLHRRIALVKLDEASV